VPERVAQRAQRLPSEAVRTSRHRVQLLVPLRYGDGGRIPRRVFQDMRRELAERFGGVTAYARAPARGWWQSGRRTERDDIVVVEVMVRRLDPRWWAGYRRRLERLLRQRELVIRRHPVRLL
jgi:hypothetical protein